MRTSAGTDLKQLEEALFDVAQQFTDAKQRSTFLDAACAGNAELRRGLEKLFSVKAEADAFFEKPAKVLLGAEPDLVAQPLRCFSDPGKSSLATRKKLKLDVGIDGNAAHGRLDSR